jgi:DNA-binding protein Fis
MMSDEVFISIDKEGKRLISEAIEGHLTALIHAGCERPHEKIVKIVNDEICKSGLMVADGNTSKLAKILGVNRGTLIKRIKQMKEKGNNFWYWENKVGS